MFQDAIVKLIGFDGFSNHWRALIKGSCSLLSINGHGAVVFRYKENELHIAMVVGAAGIIDVLNSMRGQMAHMQIDRIVVSTLLPAMRRLLKRYGFVDTSTVDDEYYLALELHHGQ